MVKSDIRLQEERINKAMNQIILWKDILEGKAGYENTRERILRRLRRVSKIDCPEI